MYRIIIIVLIILILPGSIKAINEEFPELKELPDLTTTGERMNESLGYPFGRGWIQTIITILNNVKTTINSIKDKVINFNLPNIIIDYAYSYIKGIFGQSVFSNIKLLISVMIFAYALPLMAKITIFIKNAVFMIFKMLKGLIPGA